MDASASVAGSGKHPLDSLLYPRSVAVVGASDNPGKWGGRVLTYLVNYGFPGTIYPINNKYEQVLGLPCYPNLKALPRAPEVVALAVPHRFVPDIMGECAERGVKHVVVITSGFGEIGEEGRARQDRVASLAREAGIRLLGPNCLGLTSSAQRMALTATLALHAGVLLEGSIGLVSQSGALAGSFLNRAQDRHVGLRYMISTGNEADLELAEFIDYMVDDPEVKVIATFIEGVKNPARFLAAIDRAAEADKPIVALKVGRSERAARAARSHTGSLTGTDTAYDALFKQKGVVRVDTFDGLLETSMLLASASPPNGEGIGAVTSSGGACGLLADRSVEIGVKLADLSAATAASVAAVLGLETVQNPVDLLAQQSNDPAPLPKILAALAADENVAAILAAITTMPGLEALAETSVEYARGGRKPLLVLSTAGSVADEALQIVGRAGIPVFTAVDECLKAVRGWVWRARFRMGAEMRGTPPEGGAPADLEALRASLIRKGRPLTEPEAKAVLAAYGIPVTRERVAGSGRQAVECARAIGYPVALKIVSPDILHKTEAGALRLGLQTDEAVLAAYEEVVASARAHRPEARIEGVLVQEMVADGLEVVVGTARDADFGPLILFGMGGIFVELLRDVAVRLAPINRWDAREMVREIRAYPILKGARGQSRRDEAAVEDVLLKLSRLLSDLGDLVEEVDLNPLLVLADGKGAKVADALIVPK